jgi:hypothetical protein
MSKRVIYAPLDIEKLVAQAYAIPRYKGSYKEGIFVDNLGKHLERGIVKIRNLKADKEFRIMCEEIFWVHDLPGIVLGDVTTIDKTKYELLFGY